MKRAISQIIKILPILIITLLIGLLGIITSNYFINKKAESNIQFFTQNQAYMLEDVFKTIEISTNDLAKHVETSFSLKNLNKNDINYMKGYTKELVPFVKNLLIKSEKTKASYFNFDPEIVKNNNMFETWVYEIPRLKERSFSVITEEPKSNLYPVNKPSLDWFYNPKTTGKPFWSDTYTDDGIYDSYISYTIPVYIEGKFIGVAGSDISIDKIRNIISNSKIYKTGYAFLLDTHFNTLVYRNLMASEKFEKINPVLYKKVKNNYVKNKDGIINYQDQNIEKIFCYKTLNNGMIFAISVPKSEVLPKKPDSQIFIIVISLLIIAFILKAIQYYKKKKVFILWNS